MARSPMLRWWVVLALLLESAGGTVHRGSSEARAHPPPTEQYEPVKTGRSHWLQPKARQILYLLSAINPILALCSNQYSTRIRVPGSLADQKTSALAGVYRTLFYFARLKPRLMYSVGAALRALQMTTPIQFVFDPGAGVGAGLNMLAFASSSRWPAMLVLGWSLSKYMWRALGATPPPRSPVPITVAVVNDPETGQAEVIPISIGLHQLSRKSKKKPMS